MSNPAPTLNQINAFNATQGTTIDFNIIGGTEVIRSNKIYIYDLSDNSLICTHLYVSTESIHELPPNTDSSIVYESGKSSADFTNNTQYYAQIQTFTDTNGTQGASGLSVAKLFWCLPTPTITLGTIPTTISTTSYNVSATYTPNTSGSATNEIQEFQFNLYSAIGALLQTSGVVLYSGGVDLSYNFSGLEVDSTYYVTLDVTTTQGMNVSAQSNTFTISIDTPTMGSASVVNNACDGYISVTSNLSSDYSHEYSVDAGEVMSFTTDSPNDIKELEVDFHPIQDGTPWMSQTPDTTPYLFRASPQLGHSYNSKLPTIVGGSVVGNQLVPTLDTFSTEGGVTKSYSDGVATISSTTARNGIYTPLTYETGHKYFLTCDVKTANAYSVVIGATSAAYVNKSVAGDNQWHTIDGISNSPSNGNKNAYVYATSTYENLQARNYEIIDLTAMLGTSIADRAYAMEQAQAGSGIAWLKSYGFISDEYESYDAGTIKSVEASEHVTRGFNQWDEEWEIGGISTANGQNTTTAGYYRSKNYIPVLGNTSYYFKCPLLMIPLFYDSDKNFISNTSALNEVITTPQNARYIRFRNYAANAWTPYQHDICINISDPSRNGEYEPYTEHSYPLGNVTLRGVPKVDANDNIYYDGDIYHADGQVDRRYIEVTLDGSSDEPLSNKTSITGVYSYSTNDVPNVASTDTLGKLVSSYLTPRPQSELILNTTSEGVAMFNWGNQIAIKINGITSLADFKTYLSNHPLTLVFESATPTTETSDPYTTPMLCDPSGTEEWVTDNGVPVGHQSYYADIYPISGIGDVTVEHTGFNQWDEQWEQGYILNGIEYASNACIRSKNYNPCVGGATYYLRCGSATSVYFVRPIFFDSDKNFVSNGSWCANATITIPNNAQYYRLTTQSASSALYGGTYLDDICFNFSDPSKNGTYEPYNPNSQTLTQEFDGSYVTYTPTTTNNKPYLFKATGDVGGDRLSESLIGGSVVWNQLVTKAIGSTTAYNLTLDRSADEHSVRIHGTANQGGNIILCGNTISGKANHVYIGNMNTPSVSGAVINFGGLGSVGQVAQLRKPTSDGSLSFYLAVSNNASIDMTITPTITDLTTFLGSTIADQAYTMEQATVGSGIAWLKSYGFISDGYVAYNAGEIKSVEATKHVTRGFNQWDEEWEVGGLVNATGLPYNATDRIRSKNFCNILPNTIYYCKSPNFGMDIFYYDADKNFIGRQGGNVNNNTFTTPTNAHYFKFVNLMLTTYNNDICINISNASKNGTCQPYDGHEYPLANITLRGIPKLDDDGNIYYDGDVYKSDGTVTRKYGYVDLGTLNWVYDGNNTRFYANISGAKSTNYSTVLAVGYETSANPVSTHDKDKQICVYGSGSTLRFYLTNFAYTDATSLKNALSGVYCVYELATQTTETTTPFTTPQICSPLGTEEYVTTNNVPVGHDTQYLKREVFGGHLDLVSGVLTVTDAILDLGTLTWSNVGLSGKYVYFATASGKAAGRDTMLCSSYPLAYAGYDEMADKTITGRNNAPADRIYIRDDAYTTASALQTALNGVQLVYELATPQTYQLTPHQIQTLVGQNNLWSDTNGEMTIMYQLPITDLLVKRKDVSQVGSQWLTLHSVPITQASDMDFTYIDFLNQYGKTYQYALVPVLAQDQSGVIVQIEGGYTTSDTIDSIFDGVYIADQTNIERVKAGAGYGNIEMNQNVGTITPIGSKYPIVVTNSKNQYHNGSIRGKIVPNDFYSNGNLSRIDMVNKRDELEQFLTNKRAKIIKDWNGKIWLVMILSNVDCAFDDNYGMGMVEFSADWVEIGDPTIQQDLYNAGLINVGGV